MAEEMITYRIRFIGDLVGLCARAYLTFYAAVGDFSSYRFTGMVGLIAGAFTGFFFSTTGLALVGIILAISASSRLSSEGSESEAADQEDTSSEEGEGGSQTEPEEQTRKKASPTFKAGYNTAARNSLNGLRRAYQALAAGTGPQAALDMQAAIVNAEYAELQKARNERMPEGHGLMERDGVGMCPFPLLHETVYVFIKLLAVTVLVFPFAGRGDFQHFVFNCILVFGSNADICFDPFVRVIP